MKPGLNFDFMAREWSCECKTCGDEFYTPTKREMQSALKIHRKKVCLGGW